MPPARADPGDAPTARASYPSRMRLHHEPDDHRGEQRHRQQPRRRTRRGCRRGVRCPGIAALSGNRSVRRLTLKPFPVSAYLQRSAERPGHQADRDAVQHDRGDHLVGARLHLQHRRDRGPGHPAEHREDHDHDDQERAGDEGRASRLPRGHRHRHDVLALHADVEHAALEAHGDGQRREDRGVRRWPGRIRTRSHRRTSLPRSRGRRRAGSRRTAR